MLLNSVSALQFNNISDVNATIEKIYYAQLNITYDNTTPHTFQIYNITVTNLANFTFDKIPNLRPNETKILNYSFLLNSIATKTEQAKIVFFYQINGSTAPQNYNLTVNSSGYEPSNITLFVNDTATWKNIDITNHTVTNVYSIPDRTIINPNGTYTRTFSTAGTFIYYDEMTSKGGYIYIYDRDTNIFVHSPNFDNNITFKIKTDYPKGNLSVQFLPSTFSMKHTETRVGIMRIETNASLYNVELTGDWFNFKTNNFTFEKDINLEFNVTSSGIISTADTNKTYQKQITVKTSNGGTSILSVPVFIEYSDINTTIAPLQNLVLIPMSIEQQYAFCSKEEINWTHQTCQKYLKNISVPVYIPQVFHPEINESSAYESIQAGKKAEEGMIRIGNKVDELVLAMSGMNTQLNDTITDTTKFKEQINNRVDFIATEVTEKRKDSNSFQINMTIILGVVLTATLIFIFLKWKESKLPELDL